MGNPQAEPNYDSTRVGRLLLGAARALDGGDRARGQHCLRTLAALPALAVDRHLRAILDLAVGSAWENGWQPSDLAYQLRRRFDGRATPILSDAMAAQLRRYCAAAIDPTWSRQLAALDATVWWSDDDRWPADAATRGALTRLELLTRIAEIVAVLITLPAIPPLCPPPGKADAAAGTAHRTAAGDTSDTAGSHARERILRKVRALLAKAESTEYPAEAETLSAQAQQLIAKYTIDEALLAARTREPTMPIGRRIGIDNPYEGPKAALLSVVARANRCRTVWHQELGLVAVLGFAADLDAVELLFTSLLVQATAAISRAGAQRDRLGRSVTRSYRHSFLLAYGCRVGERLAAATTEATAAADDRGGDPLPVLAARRQAVDDAVDRLFGRLVRSRSRPINNASGWHAGRAAADLASLHHRGSLHERSRPPRGLPRSGGR
jgi:hypothetical protein